MTRIVTPSTTSIAEAAALLKAGGLLGLPTETVYGLAADATQGHAVARIFEAKGRPHFNPLIVHVASIEDAQKYGVFDAQGLATLQAFWPGPLSVIVKQTPHNGLSALATAGLDTVALRCPAHPIARAVIAAAGVPLAAPSANISGTLSTTTPQHVAESLGAAVDMILAAGPSNIGLESTVLDLTGDVPAILRRGAISADDISRVIEADVVYDDAPSDTPKSPGQLLRHYAPTCPLRLGATDVRAGEALLGFGPAHFIKIAGGGTLETLGAAYKNLSVTGDLHEAASNLFAHLRALDQPAHTAIAVMDIPRTGLGAAIWDRLSRGAGA